MAFITQEQKKEIAPVVKKILQKYGLKGTLSIKDHTQLILTIRSGYIDFIQNNRDAYKARGEVLEHWQLKDYVEVNHYHIDKTFSGVAREALEELNAAINQGNWDNSNPMIDYHNVGWYTRINIGTWSKYYELVV